MRTSKRERQTQQAKQAKQPPSEQLRRCGVMEMAKLQATLARELSAAAQALSACSEAIANTSPTTRRPLLLTREG